MQNHTKNIIVSALIILFVGCASESVNYDLPSAGVADIPEWVEAPREVRDTLFFVINLPEDGILDMDKSVQKAQSELHTLLMNEVEVILRDYWEQKELNYSEDKQFQLLAGLPVSLEEVMNHVSVKDGWDKNGEVSILCALDYEEVAKVLMDSMSIEDPSFNPYLKRRMDILAQDHR